MNIKIQLTEQSKIDSVDFNNLSFGSVFSRMGGNKSISPPDGVLTDAQEHKQIINNK